MPSRLTLCCKPCQRRIKQASLKEGLELLFKPETFAEHPEWFGFVAGKRRRHSSLGSQFCWTHEGAIRAFTENVKAFLDKM